MHSVFPGRSPAAGLQIRTSALLSSVLFRGGIPRPPAAVVLARTRSNCVAARRGGKQRMRTRSTIMTNKHDSATVSATSLLGTGEVCRARARHPTREITDARREPAGVVGDSRSGKEDTCKCRRSAGTERTAVVGRPAEVRAAIRTEKWGNSHGVKGGRKVNVR